MDPAGVDEAAAVLELWLTEAGAKRNDVLRIRLTMGELLAKICEHGEGSVHAELILSKLLGVCRLRVRFGGERWDPTRRERSDMEELSEQILARTGFLPACRWRGGRNELRLQFPVRGDLLIHLTPAFFQNVMVRVPSLFVVTHDGIILCVGKRHV